MKARPRVRTRGIMVDYILVTHYIRKIYGWYSKEYKETCRRAVEIAHSKHGISRHHISSAIGSYHPEIPNSYWMKGSPECYEYYFDQSQSVFFDVIPESVIPHFINKVQGA